MTSEEVKKSVLSNIAKTIENINSVKEVLCNYNVQKFQSISNIGIIWNNKLNEIARIYQEKKMNFYTEKDYVLNRLILIYLRDIVAVAIEKLKAVAISKEEDSLYYKKKALSFLKEYENLCEEVFSFDIKKDILKAINSNKDILKYENVVEQINNELASLGYTKFLDLETPLSELKK